LAEQRDRPASRAAGIAGRRSRCDETRGLPQALHAALRALRALRSCCHRSRRLPWRAPQPRAPRSPRVLRWPSSAG